MPKALSEKEREEIQQNLEEAVVKLISTKGLKGTTVDELTKAARIPKGTFYLFYPSKEMLIFSVINKEHDKTYTILNEEIKKLEANYSIEEFTTLLVNSFLEAKNSSYLTLLKNGELDLLMRKLSDETVKAHQEEDEDFFTLFKTLFPRLNKEQIKLYSASTRALFFTLFYEREIGEDYESVLKLLLRGLADQMEREGR